MTDKFDDLASAIDWIRQRISERGMDVKSACAGAGVSRGAFYQVVVNPSSMSGADFVKLCGFLGIEDSELAEVIRVWLRERAGRTVLGPAVAVLIDELEAALSKPKARAVFLRVADAMDGASKRRASSPDQ